MRFPILFPRTASRPALGIALLWLLVPAPPTLVSLTPSAASGTNLTLTVEGTGFDPGASRVEVRRADGHLLAKGAPTRRSASRLEATVDLAGASPGTYDVTVVNPDGTRSNASSLTLRPEVTITPRSGRPGTLFTYAGRGFTGGLDAITHLEGPTAVAFQSKRITTTPAGTFEQQIDSAEFRPGTFTVWAVDDRTGVGATAATFEIVRGTPSSPPPRD